MQIRVLNVAEKPSAAKEIANILGQRPSSRQGHSPYNRIFDFEYRIPALGPGNCQMAMTSVAGHLMELEFPPQFRSWDRCNPKTLFEAPVLKSVKQNMSGIEKTLRSEAKKSQHLILWLDCDREGENIAFEVIQVCKEANSRLRIHRAKFSAFIPREIHGSMENLVAPDENMSNAVDARQEIDLRIGAAFTRFQTRLLGKYFPPKTIISYGPCQFPTLGFVLDRHYQIENFISEPYWNIDFQYQFNALNARENSSMVKFNWSRGPIYDQLCCLILYEICLENPLAKVTAVQRKEVKKWKPLPLSTITFQKLAAQKLRMSSHQAMEVAESLYQKGFVSYPRTETDQYSQDFDFHGCIRSQTGSPVYGEFASSLLDGNRFQRPRNGKNNDKAHPPIHPTKHPENLESLSQDQKKVFDIIVRHFLGSCSKDAIGDQTNVHVCIGDEQFTCSGLIIRERNYLDIYTYESWSTRTLPAFYEGQVFSPTIFEMTESRTSPPALLTEEELIALMYKNGIGTDATIPAHIETILKREYVIKEANRYFKPTKLGISLAEGYEQMSLDLTKPRLRAEMEASMELVGLGLKTKSAFLEHSIAQAASVFEIVTEKANLLDRSIARYFQMRTDTERSIREVNSQFSKCGSCGNLMALKEISQENGFKTGTLNCRTCARSLNLNNLPSCPSDKTCPICGFQVVMMTGMNSGKLYPVCPFCSVNPPAEFAGKSDGVSFKCFQCSHPSCSLSGSKPSSSFSVRRCFVCKSAMFLKSYERNGISNYFLGCSKYPNCSGSVWMRFPSLEFAEASSSTCNRCSEPSLPIHLLRIKCSDPLFVNQNLESQDDFICAGGCSVSVEGFLNQSSSSSRSSSSQRSSSTRTSSRGEVARESKKNSKTSARKISTVRRNLK